MANHIEPIEKILAEFSVTDLILENTIGRGKNTRVGTKGTFTPHTFKGLFLERAQELGLKLDGNLPHFVEKERSSGGLFKTTKTAGDSPGEGALFVAKKLTLKKIRRDRRAVHDDKRSLGTAGVIVDGASNKFFARAALASDENRNNRFRSRVRWS